MAKKVKKRATIVDPTEEQKRASAEDVGKMIDKLPEELIKHYYDKVTPFNIKEMDKELGIQDEAAVHQIESIIRRSIYARSPNVERVPDLENFTAATFSNYMDNFYIPKQKEIYEQTVMWMLHYLQAHGRDIIQEWANRDIYLDGMSFDYLGSIASNEVMFGVSYDLNPIGILYFDPSTLFFRFVWGT